MNQQKKIRTAPSLLLAILLTGSIDQPIWAQAQTWNTKARERSQAANSAGMTALNKGQIAAGTQLFRDAINYDPQDPVPFSSLGLSLAVAGNYQQALDALQNSYSLSKSAETLLSTGIVYYLDHDYDAALNSWNKAFQLDPKLDQVYADMGFVFLRKGDLNQAEQAFAKAVRTRPSSQIGFQGLATTAYLRGDFSQSRKAAEQAESICSYPPVMLLLAKLDFLEGNNTAGRKRVEKYNATVRKAWQKRSMTAIGYPSQRDFHFDPFLADNLDNGYLCLARVQSIPRESSRQRSLAKQGKADSVIETARRNLAGASNDFYLLRELGLAQLARGDWANAAESFKKVLSICPDCSTDLLHMGRALFLSGRTAEAATAVRTFQRMRPGQQLSSAIVEMTSSQSTSNSTAPDSARAGTGTETFKPLSEDRAHPRGGIDSSPSGF